MPTKMSRFKSPHFKHKIIRVAIYGNYLIDICYGDLVEIQKHFKFPVDLNVNASVFETHFHEKQEIFEHVILVVGPDTTIPQLVHECIHLKNKLFKDIGHTLDVDNDEPEAYLTQYIFRMVTDKLKELKPKE